MTYENELKHYGVKGMRWGHRKASYYDERVAANLKRASTAKTAKGRMRAQNRAEINKYYADRARRISKATTLKDRIAADYGAEDAVKSMNAYTNIEKNKAAAAKTKLGKHIHTVNAKNNEAATQIVKNVGDAKTIKGKAEAALKSLATTKVTRLSGRSVGLGESIVEEMIPGMALMRDYEYLRDRKN